MARNDVFISTNLKPADTVSEVVPQMDVGFSSAAADNTKQVESPIDIKD